jgi:hypothetical protein
MRGRVEREAKRIIYQELLGGDLLEQFFARFFAELLVTGTVRTETALIFVFLTAFRFHRSVSGTIVLYAKHLFCNIYKTKTDVNRSA